MSSNRMPRLWVALVFLLGCIAGPCRADPPGPEPGTLPPGTTAPLQIVRLLNGDSGEVADQHVGLNDKLAVVLNQPPPHPASQYALYLNGTEVATLGSATFSSVQTPQGLQNALIFKLVRNEANGALWKDLLGSPTRRTAAVSVALGEPAQGCGESPGCRSQLSITGAKTAASFSLQILSWAGLGLAAGGVLLTLIVVWWQARTRTALRDNLLPQIHPKQQPYSLARWQMAFWFVLIFASFLFLYLLLWDYNTISPQALALMGISSTTALASIGVDALKDSPADAANRGLKALGLHDYSDVLRIQQEIEHRHTQLTAGNATGTAHTAASAHVKQLHGEIQDRRNILRMYEDKIRPFVTQGWFQDLTTDLNGTALHRLQALCWTVALGVVFLIGVYRDLTMPPEFSGTLLTLMGLSSAGYVGLKVPEKNN